MSITSTRSGYKNAGFLNVHKPSGMTSHDVVAQVRRLLNTRRVGHGGTLDPMASGVLPIALNQACRLIRFLPDTKTYLAQILLGTTTDTDDVTGTVIHTSITQPDPNEVVSALSKFFGEIQQTPPNFSAIHVGGKRLYQLARAGSVPEAIPTRIVTIYDLEIIKIEMPVLEVRIGCSSGFYIRSLARDLGRALGCGGCLKYLLREQSGNFKIENAISLEQLKLVAQNNSLSGLLISPAEALPFTELALSEEQAKALVMGQKVEHPGCAASATLQSLSRTASKVRKCSTGNESKSDEMPLLLANYEDTTIAVCRTARQGQSMQLVPEVVLADSI